jgi:LmbE family N-acetylglucosaminyl deacetylase
VNERTVVHLAPHPDDELLGAPSSLYALRDAGWRVVNVACTLGRPSQRERRLAEVIEACRRAGFELLVELTPAEALAGLTPELVVCPSPHDHHPTHEQIGRETLRAVRAAGAPARVWLWALYADLGLPTVVRTAEPARLAEIADALEAHVGESARVGLRRLLRARAEAAAVIAAERVFGFGSPTLGLAGAELLTELALLGDRFRLCEPRLAEADELGEAGPVDVTDWLDEPSLTTRFGSRHAPDA